MKMKLLSTGIVSIAALMTATKATAAVIVAPFSSPPAPPDRNDVFVGESLSITGDANTNPVWSFWNDQTLANEENRYFRFRMDLRSNQFNIDPGGGTPAINAYSVLPSNGSANTILTDPSHGWDDTLTGSGTIQFATSAGLAENGFTSGGIVNWVLFRPDGQSTAAPVQSDNAADDRAVAFGFSWDDANDNDIIDTGDTVSGLYAVTADTFAEMDTVGELNAAVAAIPEANFALGAFLVLALTMTRRGRRV